MKLKKDFPIFARDPTLVYLDSGATSLKPASVIEKEAEYYTTYSANIFRGVYKISERATQEYEAVRGLTAQFLNGKEDEIVFTRNTTESLNLIAYGLGRQIIDSHAEIVTTVMEHHSNFVPWQQLAFENGATFKVIGVDKQGYLLITNDELRINNEELARVITKKTKILALTAVSNVLGTINPIREITAAAKKINPEIIVIVDAAQAAPHMKIDVQDWGCDFVALSSHKMLGPTGVGVLWGKKELLEKTYPFQYGGEMINEVAIEQSTYKEAPYKFEAGTPNIAGVIAFGAALKYISDVGLEAIRRHEKEIYTYAHSRMQEEFGAKITHLGPHKVEHHAGLLAFTFDGYHPHDIAQILDESNIAVRAGHHCAMPLHTALEMPATTRASFYIYNDKKDIDAFIQGLKKVEELLHR